MINSILFSCSPLAISLSSNHSTPLSRNLVNYLIISTANSRAFNPTTRWNKKKKSPEGKSKAQEKMLLIVLDEKVVGWKQWGGRERAFLLFYGPGTFAGETGGVGN